MNNTCGYTKVVIEHIPLTIWYEYNRDQGEIEKISVYVPNDNQEEYDLYDLLSSRFEREIADKIMEEVNHE